MNDLIWFGVPFSILMLLALPTAVLVRVRHDLPLRVERALAERPRTARLLGAANLVLVVLVSSAAKAHPALGVVTLLLLLLLALLLFLGFSGVALALARRLRPSAPADAAGPFALAWLILAGVPLLPLFGPLYFLWHAASAVGAPLLALNSR